MTAIAETTQPAVADLATLARSSLAGPASLRSLREAALARFVELGLPTAHHEDWRFTSLSELAATSFALRTVAPKVTHDQVAAFAVPGLASHTLVFVDGIYAPQLSDIRRLPDGVRVTTLHEAFSAHRALVETHLGKIAPFDKDAFAAMNTAFLGDGVFIHVPRNVRVDDPVILLNIATHNGAQDPAIITNPRNLIIAEDHSGLRVVEHYVALGDYVYFTNAVTEFFTGDNCHATHYFIEEESRKAFSVSALHARTGRGTTFRSHSVLLGGAMVRNVVNPIIDGEGGNVLVNGLFVPTGEQVHDNFMRVEHLKPHCESHQYYNGIVADQARGVFCGRIFVAKEAQKTDAKQTSANLLLSDSAQIDTMPQLEIYADDVKCTHGATIGQLDEDAMFYLQARGISRDAARAMLVFAFAAETFARMRLEPIREMLERKMLSRLPEGDFLASVL